MATETDAPASEAAPETPTAEAGTNPPPTAQTPTPENPEAATTPLDEVTEWDELERRLTANENAKPDAKPEEKRPEAEEEVPVGETPTEADPDDPAEEEEALPKNFRFHTEDPKRAKFLRLMRQNPEANPVDLAKIAGYEMPKGETAASAPEAKGAPETAKADPLKALRDQIAGLVASKKAAREAYEFDKADELGEQLLDARLELERRTRELADQERDQAEYDAEYQASRQKADRAHPESQKAGSRQNRLLRMLIASKEQDDAAFFDSPDYPMRLIAELERDFPDAFPKAGTAPAAKPAATKAPPAPPARNGQTSRPIGQAVAASNGGKPPLTGAALEEAIDNMSLEDLEKLANETGTRVGRN